MSLFAALSPRVKDEDGTTDEPRASWRAWGAGGLGVAGSPKVNRDLDGDRSPGRTPRGEESVATASTRSHITASREGPASPVPAGSKIGPRPHLLGPNQEETSSPDSTLVESMSPLPRGREPRSKAPALSTGRTNKIRADGRIADAEDSDEEEPAKPAKCCGLCASHKESRGICYFCFVLIFAGFVIVFPLFLKWLVSSPMPSEYWNEEYPKFPALEDKDFIQEGIGRNYSITMSEIPNHWHGCNHSCITDNKHSADMSFAVDMTLEAPAFPHTAYPVLLASNDFHSWWMASDRTDASGTMPFFASQDAGLSSVYRKVTEECIRPPVIEGSDFATSTGTTTPAPHYQATDEFSSRPIYVVVCVTWSHDSLTFHRKNDELSVEDVAQHCQAVGGVCGWPCGSNPGAVLPGCSSSGIIDTTTTSLGGVPLAGANFSGDIQLRACVDEPGSKECTTTSLQMSEWPCHECTVQAALKDINLGAASAGEEVDKLYTLEYDSLPKMEVLLGGTELGDSDAVPRAFVMTTTVDPTNTGPDALVTQGATFKKLYYNRDMVTTDPNLYPHPVPSKVHRAKQEESEELATLSTNDLVEKHYDMLRLLDTEHNKMEFVDQSKVTLNSQTCFASRGPMYLVACAVNESTYANFFSMDKGQAVAPPPFNDRCLAITGKCAYACMSQQTPVLAHCDANGYIPQEELFQDFEVPVNEANVVVIFMSALLIGFAVKLMTYCPGLFSPDKHPQHYHPRQTEEFKYIAVVTPSGGETKACCIRNLLGAISALPVGCQCPFHVIFADEGHRHPHKVAFRAFVAVMHRVPENRVSTQEYRVDGRAIPEGNCKEQNLKDLTKVWVEQTRTLTLKDCETARMATRIKELQKQGGGEAEVKALNDKIDALSGLKALKTLQQVAGWPKPEASSEVRGLEAAMKKLRDQFTVGEKDIAGTEADKNELPRALHLDDCEDYYWSPSASKGGEPPKRLYTLHYVARAKPEEDERTLKVQHVARGTWYYRLPKDPKERERKSWLDWRERAQVYHDGETNDKFFVVPLRTSRGKAGGLNFVENYLFDYTSGDVLVRHGLFSIADARHQFQPDFFHETIPFFFKQNNNELDPRVAFTQSPQYFPEMPDDVDYLDTNNANFFRLNCMLRNCCGGVSSCGTNGTWMVRDRRAGKKGVDSIWEPEETPRLDYMEKLERRFFHESCKVEDTASSLDRVVQGKHSQYVNRRLSYGMAKDPTDYLAAVQRWAEGGVVLSLQTFLSCKEGIHMIWMSAMLFALFVLSLVNIVYGPGYQGFLKLVSKRAMGDEQLFDHFESAADWFADRAVEFNLTEEWVRQVWVDMFLEVQIWICVVLAWVFGMMLVSYVSSCIHACGRHNGRRTRFPTSMAQWARLAITLDNLTYFCWFWTAFFWIGFNYYAIWGRRWYHFEASGMVFFSYILQVLGWSLVISASARYRTEMGAASNEVFFLTLTNVWRTTQLFYITAPLILYSLIMGFLDFSRNRTLDVDISYWVGGDRGAVSKSIAQWWTLLLIIGAIASHIGFWFDLLPYAEGGTLLIVTFIALDVMHPCAFLWLGPKKEPLPEPPSKARPSWQRCPLRFLQLLFSLAFYRNTIRSMVFHPRSTGFVKWIGPFQNVLFPILTWFMPELGVNQALLLLASSRT